MHSLHTCTHYTHAPTTDMHPLHACTQQAANSPTLQDLTEHIHSPPPHGKATTTRTCAGLHSLSNRTLASPELGKLMKEPYSHTNTGTAATITVTASAHRMRRVEPARPHGWACNELKWVPKHGALVSYNRQHIHRPRHQTCHIHIAHRDTSLASQAISLPTLAKPCPSQGSQPASPQLPQVSQASLHTPSDLCLFPWGRSSY